MPSNDDDDWKDFGEVMRNARQQRHANWKAENTALIEASGIPFTVTNNGEALVIRERGRPRIDFYPSTGRWRVDNLRTLGGHAERFLKWYKEQPHA